jgi:hypothetical protein
MLSECLWQICLLTSGTNTSLFKGLRNEGQYPWQKNPKKNLKKSRELVGFGHAWDFRHNIRTSIYTTPAMLPGVDVTDTNIRGAMQFSVD